MVPSRPCAGIVVAAITAAAHAQSVTPPVGVDPATTMKYQSAFSGYRPFADVEILAWRKANGDAATMGGHMGQMKHDAMPAVSLGQATAATPAAVAPSPMPTGTAPPSAMKVHP